MKTADNNRFEAGNLVYAKENPKLALIVRRYVDRIYYCNVRDNSDHKELVYFDRELLGPKQV